MPLQVDLPADLAAVAGEANGALEESLIANIPAPSKPYNPKVLDALTKSISGVVKLMGLDLPAAKYSGPQESLDPEVVRFLSMVAAAADAYGSPLPMGLEDIKGDAEITAITAHLMELAKDRGFKDFLEEPADEPDEVIEEEVIDDGGDADFDFAARL